MDKVLKKTINFNGQQIRTFEEKETDIHIAAQMIRNIVPVQCDICFDFFGKWSDSSN
ncbi:MAG: hypothetical protein PHY57_12370 [Ignavibacterium sp.]|nr:hypothetical protein [Ignavibacterium sp.]